MESVVLALDTGVLDHAAGVGLEAGHGAADVAVDFDDFFDRGGFEEGGGNAFFDAEDYAGGGGDLRREEISGWVGLGVKERVGTPIAVEPSLMASREYST